MFQTFFIRANKTVKASLQKTSLRCNLHIKVSRLSHIPVLRELQLKNTAAKHKAKQDSLQKSHKAIQNNTLMVL